MAKLTFDENNLTIGDLEDFEDAIGVPLTEALKAHPVKDEDGNVVRDEETGRPLETVNMTAKVLKGLVWIASRQENPDFTLADARDVKITELDIVRAGADEDGNDSPALDPKE